MEEAFKMVSKKTNSVRILGINAALFSAFFLGLAPIFGKKAIELGVSPLGVVAARTLLATLLLLIVMVFFNRRYLFIYPAGLIGCLLAGSINGLGSLFYYSALGKIDAGLGQLLYSLYPFFVAFWMFLDKQKISKMTVFRLLIVIPAVILLIQPGISARETWLGSGMMLLSAALYALHLPINQRVLFDIPAPTVTLYTLLAMSAVVVPAYLFTNKMDIDFQITAGWMPILGLTLVTFFSRLTLFTGVKHLGGLQTALLGLSELFITLLLSHLWLKESLAGTQWIGAGLLFISILLVAKEEKTQPKKRQGGWLGWLSGPASVHPQDIIHPHD